MRQRFRASTFAIGVLHEGLNRVDGLHEYYQNVDYFDNGFGTWVSDKKIRNFRTRLIQTVRNQMSFHFDTEVVRHTIANEFDLTEYILVSANSDIAADMFFELAETIEFDYLVREFKSNEEKLTATKLILNTVAEITIKFIKSTDLFMAGILRDLNVNAHKLHFDILQYIDDNP